MTEDEADALAVQRLRYLFKPDRIASIIRRRAPVFNEARAIDLIREGKIDAVVGVYDAALKYQG